MDKARAVIEKDAAGPSSVGKILTSLWRGSGRLAGKASKGLGTAARRASLRINRTPGPSLASTLFNTAFSAMDPISAYDAYHDFKEGNIAGGVGNTLLTLAGIMTQGDAARGLHRWFGLGKNNPLYLTMTHLGRVGEGTPALGRKLGLMGWPLRHPIIAGMGLTTGSSLLDNPKDPDEPRRIRNEKPLW